MTIQPTTTATIHEALTSAIAVLTKNEHLRETASRDAELLLLHQLEINKATLFAHPERELTEVELQAYEASIHRRAQNEPIQYITGTQEFYGLPFQVTPAVLIPRPETELLIESVLERLPHNQPLTIADIGTGSGIIAITLATHLPYAEFTAIDISPEALAIARRNAETHQVAGRISFVESNLLDSIPSEHFDAVVSNPPYVPTTETLHPQVHNHEPHTALYAGPTGLDIYTRLIPQAHAALKPAGLLALEIGHGQSGAIRQLLSGWKEITFLKDLQQIPRAVLARKIS